MQKVCESYECELLEFNSELNHTHILVAYPPKVSIPSLVNSLKGVSARHIRKLQLPEIKDNLWGTAFWSPSYCASRRSFLSQAGGASLAILKRYIQGQRSPAPT
jgi:putative transposase